MNRKKLLCFTLFFFLIMVTTTVIVSAQENTWFFSPMEAFTYHDVGDEISYLVEVSSENSMIVGDIICDGGLTLSSVTAVDDGFEVSTDGNHFEAYRKLDFTTSVLKVTFRIERETDKRNYHIYMKNILVDGEKREDKEEVLYLKSNNTTLSKLQSTDGILEPAFSPATREYYMQVPKDLTEVHFLLNKNSFASYLDDVSDAYTVSFPPESEATDVNIRIQAQNGDIGSYTIHLSRKEEEQQPVLSSDTSLKKLLTSAGSIAFDPNKLSYVVEVGNEVDTFSFIEVLPTSDKASVTLPEVTSLQIGQNDFYFTITSENGNEMVYSFRVNRSKALGRNRDNSLQSLTINGKKIAIPEDGMIPFATDQLEPLTIDAIPMSAKSQITIQGNENIQEGSIVSLIVTSESGENQIYSIQITTKKDTWVWIFIVLLFSLSTIFIISTIYIIKKNHLQWKKNKKGY